MGFQNIYNKNLPGYIDYAGNTLGLNGACTSFSNIYTGCNSAGTSGVCGAWVTTDITKYASNNWHNFVLSLPASDTNGGTTFDYNQNSSSDSIMIPSDTSIDYAVLIWSGASTSSSVDISTKQVKLTDPLNTIHTITPQYSSTNTSSYGYYTCATDVTQIVKDGGNGYYTAGSIYSEFLTNIACAGWLLFVVYTAPTLPFYNININIGNLDANGDNSPSTLISGFRTAPTGTPILADLILTALNGNPASPGDQVSLTNSNNIETYLYGPFNPVDNFFGAQIEDIQGSICTSGTFSNLNATPNTIQTTSGRRMGYDISCVDISYALSHGQLSTTLTGVTTGNNYSITSATSLVENSYPYFIISPQTSDSTVLIGDNFTITYNLENTGTITTNSLDFTFDDTGLQFVSGSYTYSGTTYQISSTPHALVLPNLDVNDSIIVTLTYTAKQIPVDLYYKNLSSLHYTFSIGSSSAENTLINNLNIQISYVGSLKVINVTPISTTPPIINTTSSNLSYSIITNGTRGNATLTGATITYTPNTIQQVTDRFIIKVLNSDNNTFINLVYNVAQVVVPIFRYFPVVPSTVNLYSYATGVYTFYNDATFDTTNLLISASIAPGTLLTQATLTRPNGDTTDMVRTGNQFTVGTLYANSYVQVNFTYKAVMIPTDLNYTPYGTSSFVIGGVNFNLVAPGGTITPIANLEYTIPENQVYSGVIPIIDPLYYALSYSLKTQGSLGVATVNSSGLVTYTPNPNVIGTDNIVIKIQNSQQNTNMDVNYTFNIVSPVNLSTTFALTIFENQVLNENIAIVDPNYPNWDYAISSQAQHGNAAVSSAGLLTYTPNSDFTGIDNFTVSVVNPDIDTTLNFNYLVTVANLVTLLFNLTYNIFKNQSFVQDISITDPDSPYWTYTIKTQAHYGTASVTSLGILTYTPNNNYTGTDNFTLSAVNSNLNTFVDINYTLVVNELISMSTSLSFTIYENELFSENIAISDSNYPNWTYAIKTQASHGVASVNSSGVLLYNPNTNFTGTDSITITMANADIETTINTNYVFTVVNPVNMPCPEYIPYKLVKLLNSDVYLMALEDTNITDNVCFDCTLWNEGYISSGIVIIPPIKMSLISILTEMLNDLQNILNDNNLNQPCNDVAFRSQVDRLVAIINDLMNKVTALDCSTTRCNVALSGPFLSLLSQTLDTLITITSTLDGILGLCSNNCSNCNSSFNNLIGIFINSTTSLSNLLGAWNNLVLSFMSLGNLVPKSYVPAYMPPTRITTTKNNFNNGFICPPKK